MGKANKDNKKDTGRYVFFSCNDCEKAFWKKSIAKSDNFIQHKCLYYKTVVTRKLGLKCKTCNSGKHPGEGCIVKITKEAYTAYESNRGISCKQISEKQQEKNSSKDIRRKKPQRNENRNMSQEQSIWDPNMAMNDSRNTQTSSIGLTPEKRLGPIKSRRLLKRSSRCKRNHGSIFNGAGMFDPGSGYDTIERTGPPETSSDYVPAEMEMPLSDLRQRIASPPRRKKLKLADPEPFEDNENAVLSSQEFSKLKAAINEKGDEKADVGSQEEKPVNEELAANMMKKLMTGSKLRLNNIQRRLSPCIGLLKKAVNQPEALSHSLTNGSLTLSSNILQMIVIMNEFSEQKADIDSETHKAINAVWRPIALESIDTYVKDGTFLEKSKVELRKKVHDLSMEIKDLVYHCKEKLRKSLRLLRNGVRTEIESLNTKKKDLCKTWQEELEPQPANIQEWKVTKVEELFNLCFGKALSQSFGAKPSEIPKSKQQELLNWITNGMYIKGSKKGQTQELKNAIATIKKLETLLK